MLNKKEHFIAITPARNEADNLLKLLKNLNSISLPNNFVWVIVLNNNSDNSINLLKIDNPNFEIIILEYQQKGNLRSGQAWRAFFHGLECIESKKEFKFLMKLDADVRLSPDYFDYLIPKNVENLGAFGGVVNSLKNREQNDLIQGAVKSYTKSALQIVKNLPHELGFDVLDEVCLEHLGFNNIVVKKSKFYLNRNTGSSEGLKEGRIRNGVMCKYVGYHPIYFFLHLIRYSFRKPYFFGSIFIAYGYVTTKSSPFENNIRELHILKQKYKLINLSKKPLSLIKQLYK